MKDLLEIAKELDDSVRLGADKDVPEGVRYIKISDTLARELAIKIRSIALWFRARIR